jgi:hypothetical protein
VAHGICALARQFRIGEALPGNLRHEQSEAVGVGQFVVFRRPIVEAKYLLVT